MSIRSWLDGLKARRAHRKVGTRRTGPHGEPIIDTQYGAPVPEWARLQAAQNMRLDPVKKAAVEALLIAQFGQVRGMEEARYRYPEAYE